MKYLRCCGREGEEIIEKSLVPPECFMMKAGTRSVYAAMTFLLLGLVWLHGGSENAAGRPGASPDRELPVAWEAAARQLAPAGLRLETTAHDSCRLEGVDPSGTVRWHALFSAFMTPRPVGYAGAVDLVAGFDDSGRITGIRILGHHETPTFVAGIDSDWFLGQFAGKTADDPLLPGQDIDGLTHATVTVEAVCTALRTGFASISSQRHAASFLPVASASAKIPTVGSPVAASSSRRTPGINNSIAIAISFCAVLLQRVIGFLPSAALVVLALGFLSPQFVSLSHLQLLSGGGLSAEAALVLCTAVLAILCARRGYCRFLCPCGRLQDILHGISIKLFPPSAELAPCSRVTSPTFRGAGRAIFWTSLILLPLLRDLPLERLEAFSALFLRNLGIWGMILSGAVLLGAFFLPRFYCRMLCPLNPLFTDMESIRRKCLSSTMLRKTPTGGSS